MFSYSTEEMLLPLNAPLRICCTKFLITTSLDEFVYAISFVKSLEYRYPSIYLTSQSSSKISSRLALQLLKHPSPYSLTFSGT